MKKRIFACVFIFVLLLGVFLRFFQLGDIPSAMDWDEVSQAYNAYSLLQTGKDEFGTVYPQTIRSFNDFKPPLYVYISTVPIKIFGLTPFAARFSSAFFGSLSILLVYFLVYEIFRKEKHGKLISLLSMFFFALSPWAIQFSRTAFDANVAVFLVLLGVCLFLRGLHSKLKWLMVVGTIILGGAVYGAHSGKIFNPLFFICLLEYGFRYFIKQKTFVTILLVIFITVNLFWFLDVNTTTRSKGVLFTSSGKALETPAKELHFDLSKNSNDWISPIIHNRRFVFVNKYLENYLAHFNLNSLFIEGDNARHHPPGMGVLYLLSLPLIIIGSIVIIKNRMYTAFLVFLWLLIAPIASSFAIDAPNYQRSLIFLPSWQILEAMGALSLFLFLEKDTKGKLLIAFFSIVFCLNIAYFFHQYYGHTDKEYGRYWQSGYKEAISYIRKYNDTDRKIVFSPTVEQGYMFYLFYNKYDPQKYLAKGGSQRLASECHAIDNAFFGACKGEIKKGDIYLTAKSDETVDGKMLKKILLPDGSDAVIIYEY